MKDYRSVRVLSFSPLLATTAGPLFRCAVDSDSQRSVSPLETFFSRSGRPSPPLLNLPSLHLSSCLTTLTPTQVRSFKAQFNCWLVSFSKQVACPCVVFFQFCRTGLCLTRSLYLKPVVVTVSRSFLFFAGPVGGSPLRFTRFLWHT